MFSHFPGFLVGVGTLQSINTEFSGSDKKFKGELIDARTDTVSPLPIRVVVVGCAAPRLEPPQLRVDQAPGVLLTIVEEREHTVRSLCVSSSRFYCK